MITLYSNDCPKCKVLKKKLDEAKMSYNTVNDIDLMLQKEFVSIPILDVNGEEMFFTDALEWIKKVQQ